MTSEKLPGNFTWRGIVFEHHVDHVGKNWWHQDIDQGQRWSVTDFYGRPDRPFGATCRVDERGPQGHGATPIEALEAALGAAIEWTTELLAELEAVRAAT